MENDRQPLIEIDGGGGSEEEEQRADLQERPDVEGDEVRPEGNDIQDEIEDELSDDLLTDDEKARKAERARKRDAAARGEQREDNSEFIKNLRDVFGTIAAPRPADSAAPTQPVQPQRRVLTKEQRAAINRNILEEEDGVLRAVEWARDEGRKDALREMGQYSAPAMADAAEGMVDRFVARKLRADTLGKAIEPYFQKLIDESDISSIATMPRDQKSNTLNDMWDIAAGRMVREKGRIKTAPSPGVGRGAGGSSGPSQRVRRSVLTDKQKKEMMDSAKTPEGKKRMARSIAEIERGVTSNPEIAKMVADNVRFEANMRASV